MTRTGPDDARRIVWAQVSFILFFYHFFVLSVCRKPVRKNLPKPVPASCGYRFCEGMKFATRTRTLAGFRTHGIPYLSCPQDTAFNFLLGLLVKFLLYITCFCGPSLCVAYTSPLFFYCKTITDVTKEAPASKKRPRVNFFVKEIMAGLTNLHNQEHI